jgi:hypothetical protein
MSSSFLIAFAIISVFEGGISIKAEIVRAALCRVLAIQKFMAATT